MSEMTVQDMLTFCADKCTGSIVDFIDSINNYYEENGQLTDKQEAALVRIYNVQQRKAVPKSERPRKSQLQWQRSPKD